MAYLDHQEAYEDFKQAVLSGIKEQFPVIGSLQRVELEGLDVKDPEPGTSDDLHGQHAAKVGGGTWASPVFATLTMKDKAGKVIQTKRMRVAEIPRMTSRHSYIVDGQEYQVDSQWQLKPGVYTRRMANGQLESRFNTPQAKEFKLLFDPATKQFNMKRGKAEAIAVYPLMKALGVDDDSLEQKWGKEIFAANKQARGAAGALTKFFRADRKVPPKDHEEALQYFTEVMGRSALDPDVTKITLGKAASNVDGDVMLRATHKMLRVQGGEPEDDRDALEYKNLRTTGDYAYDKMTDWQTSRSVRSRMQRQVNHATDIRQVVKFGMMNDPIKKTFKTNTAARTASQINPLEMAAAAQQTTIMGPGGIQNAQVINNTISLKLVNPSHLGFLDPVKTPEGPNTGITLRLPTGVRKINGEAKTPLYNLRTNRLEYLGPAQFHNVSVVLPDQVTWENGKPKPKTPEVTMSQVGNKLTTGKFKDADYVLRHPSQLFSLTTNLIPFLGSTSGNRATYAGTQMEQAISLKHREAPLVQVGTGVKDPAINSFEGILGRQGGHVSLRNGTVTEVKKDAIMIKANDGKMHEVQLYNNFPLNEPKSMLTSTPTVKVGDKVRAGDSVADTNYTKNGKLALGTNLRVAYIPFKGYNFEDGVVVSHSASQKMVSEHLYKESTKLPDDAVRDMKKFRNQHQEAFNDAQYKKLDDEGVIRVGQKVSPGDPLIIAMTPFKIKDRMGISAVRRSMSGQHTDASTRWKGDYTGEIAAVHRKNDGTITVHVKTEEPLQVGDKITGRYGNKGIVTQVLDDDKMPHTKDGKHIEVALNPSGVPGRMNLGQVLETAAAKIALKLGKPYIVNNFDGTNAVESVKADLKKHGISDQEELFDPDTKQSLGKAMVGPQHMLKLVHQVEHKISVRSGMAAFAGETPEKYDNNLIPSGSGKIGAQSIGHNGLYTLLAHGAKANIREMQTWKSEGSDPETHPGKKWPSQHTQVWSAIQSGEPLPTPTPTFSFQKFTDMLKAAGINMQKQGNQLKLLPFTDKQTLALSNGEIKKPDLATFAKVDSVGELQVMTGGIFDPKITGGHGGKGWSHIKLPEPVPNPVFEGAIRKLTGLKEEDFNNLASGMKALTKTGKIVDLDTPGAVVGGHAIKQLLDAIDPEKELRSAEKQLSGMKLTEGIAHGASTQKVDALVKKIKYLRSLQQAGMKPSEAYVIQHLPVIPPAMRPISIMDGDVNAADLNGLYKDLGQLVTRMKDPTLMQHLTEEGKMPLRRDIYDGVKAVMGMDKLTEEKQKKGVLHLIAATGSQPKFGFFQQTLLKRKQDLTMRSTIIPEPALGLDEVGLPKEKALQLYKPFVVRKMVEIGAARSPLSAQELIKNKDPGAYRALEIVTQERPVLLKRDPALHLHSIQAFRPKLVHGSAIQIHPLTTSGFNADFDGDSIDLDTPIPLKINGNVTMQTGRQLIELLNAGDGDYICETRDVEAWTYDGWRPVKNVSFHMVEEKKKFCVTLKNGISFIVSEDHSLMVGHKEVKPTQLTVGIELDHAIQITPKKAREGGLYEQGVAYGNFLGDGCAEVRRQGGGRIAIACLPPVEREYLMDIWRTEFEGNPSPYVYGFHVNGVDRARHFLEVCGRYCDGKFVGDFLLNRGTEFLKGLLAGYILSDGSVELTQSGSYLVRTWSRSKQLRDGMSFVATLLGLPHALRERTAKGKINYLISFGKEAIKLLDYRCPGKKGELIRQALHDYEHDRNDDRRSQSARGFEVLSIEEVDYDDRMIDIEVADEQHVFAIFGGVIVHNTMSAYVPISAEAVREAQGMFPSNNLYNEATGKVIYTPTLEAALGLFKLSRITGDTNKSFSTPAEALRAVKDGKLDINHTVLVEGKKVTAGRLLIAAALPQPMQKDYLNADPKQLINKEGLNTLFDKLAKNHKGEFGTAANRLKDLGNGASYGSIAIHHPGHTGTVAIALAEGKSSLKRDYIPLPTHSLSLEDFSVDHKIRDKFVNAATKEVDVIKRSRATDAEKDRRTVEVWKKTMADMTKAHFERIQDNPSNLALMVAADVKPSKNQYRQMVLSPGVLEDATGRDIPHAVTRSYSEGLDLAGYWTQMHGARGGTIKKVQEVRDPGAFSKQLMQATMGSAVITTEDCGTQRGVVLNAGSKEVHDRILAADFSAKGMHIPRGTLLSSDVVTKIRSLDKDASLLVRSTLKCEHEKGVCQKCAGMSPNGSLYNLGTNLGVLSAQTLGERSVQLTLKAFHSGGVSSGSASAVTGFKRVSDLTNLPETISNSATIAMKGGTIDKIEHDVTGVKVWIANKLHHIGKDQTGALLSQPLSKTAPVGWVPPKLGMRVEAGQVLSDPARTLVNPHDLYKATGSMERVQNFLTDELYSLYAPEGVRRQHVETVVRSMGELTKVRDAGDAKDVMKGEYRNASHIRAVNKELSRQGKRPVEHSPILKGINVLPLEVQEDWMAKLMHQRLKGTIIEAAAMGQTSDIHGTHPIPGVAFGAEFGLTKKDSLKPGLGHLKNVSDFHY